MSMSLLASMVGSAWSGSPWLRMQSAHPSSNRVGFAVLSVVRVRAFAAGAARCPAVLVEAGDVGESARHRMRPAAMALPATRTVILPQSPVGLLAVPSPAERSSTHCSGAIGGSAVRDAAGSVRSRELMSPGGPQPLIHQAGTSICLPHTLLAFTKTGLFMLMPVPLKLVWSPIGVGVVGDPVRPHAVGVLDDQGRVGIEGGVGDLGPQHSLGRGQVLAARAGDVVESLAERVARVPARDGDVDPSVGIDHRVGLVGIAVAAHAGSPLVNERGRVAGLGQRGCGAPVAVTAAGPHAGARRQAGDGRGAGPLAGGRGAGAAARGQRDGRRDARTTASPPDRRYVVVIFRLLPCAPERRYQRCRSVRRFGPSALSPRPTGVGSSCTKRKVTARSQL